MMNSHQHAVDVRLIHRETAQAALTADTTFTPAGQRAQTRTKFITMVNLESVKISANNEQYNFLFELSNDGFATTETAAVLSLGATEVRLGNAIDNLAGDNYQVYWNTEMNGIAYKDWRIRMDVSGTSPSIGFSMHTAA